ncbi:hypothetical protein U9M48_014848 [Paspalum notatum var. saurae]|uniref:Uncharacterized protein n=1 Tax=Paspalum notatum var. saurae TaxID=547442 RepID=A0AAQ3WL92_PASNO
MPPPLFQQHPRSRCPLSSPLLSGSPRFLSAARKRKAKAQLKKAAASRGEATRRRHATPSKRTPSRRSPSLLPSPFPPSPPRPAAGMRPAPASSADADADAHQSRLLCELCALLLTVLRASPEDGARPLLLPRQVTPAGVASMLLGASMALMLCGSVTFMLGFFLMPWVVGLGCLFLFVGFLTNLSGIWRALLLWPSAACGSPKDAASSSPCPVWCGEAPVSPS